MPGQPHNRVSYGLSDALLNVFPAPIQAKRAPTVNDTGYLIGQIWVWVAMNDAWILTAIVDNFAQWQLFQTGGGAGTFSSLTVNPGPTNLSTVGNGAVTIGNATNTGAVTIASGSGGVAVTGGGNAISFGADAAANTITIGSATAGETLSLLGGNSTGLGTAAVIVATAIAGDIQIGNTNQTGTLYLAPSTAAHTVNLSAGANTGAQVVNISSGASAANSTVNILTGNGSAGTQTLNALTGTRAGAANIGTGAAAHVITIGSSTAGNITNLNSPITALPGPVYIYTGAGAPSNGLALHVGDLYINTTAASATTRMYIATAASTWTNFTCAA